MFVKIFDFMKNSKYAAWVSPIVYMLFFLVLGGVIFSKCFPEKTKTTIEKSQLDIEKEKNLELTKKIFLLNEKITSIQNEKKEEIVVVIHEEIKSPDGTVKTKTETKKETKEEKIIEKIVVKTETKIEYLIKEVEKEIIKEVKTKEIKEVNNSKYWRVGLLGLVQPRIIPTPEVSNLSLGLEVERKIIGPLNVGLVAFTNRELNVMVGVKVSVDF
jgi:hypothetical protein